MPDERQQFLQVWWGRGVLYGKKGLAELAAKDFLKSLSAPLP